MDVTIGCGCPPLADGQPRHTSDTVVLHEPILPIVRRAILYDLGSAEQESEKNGSPLTLGDKLALLSEGYLLRCIDSWSLEDEILDAKGRPKIGPLPPSRDNIRRRLLDQQDFGDPVAKAADDLYTDVVLLPLLLGASSSSSPGPTSSETSQGTNGSTPPKKRSTRSSTTSSPMGVTGSMQASSGGGSSS